MKKLCLGILVIFLLSCASIKVVDTQAGSNWLFGVRWILALQTEEDAEGYQEIIFFEFVFTPDDVLMIITNELYLSGKRVDRKQVSERYNYEILEDCILIDGGLELLIIKKGLVLDVNGKMYEFMPVQIETNFKGTV